MIKVGASISDKAWANALSKIAAMTYEQITFRNILGMHVSQSDQQSQLSNMAIPQSALPYTHYVNNTEDYKQHAGTSEITG